MSPRRSSRSAQVALGLIAAVALSGCGGGDAPGPSATARPPQPAAAKREVPIPAPAALPPYVYQVKDRRDPFRPLIQPKVVVEQVRPAKKRDQDALEVNQLKLAGIIWEQRGFFALVEAPNGKGYVLRVNDTVGDDARVAKITPEAVTFEVKSESPVPQQQAQARLVELRLKKEE